jgi:hypothetical protein
MVPSLALKKYVAFSSACTSGEGAVIAVDASGGAAGRPNFDSVPCATGTPPGWGRRSPLSIESARSPTDARRSSRNRRRNSARSPSYATEVGSRSEAHDGSKRYPPSVQR